MSARNLPWAGAALFLGLYLSGCAETKPFDYTNFRQHRPRSILVLPPVSQSTDIRGTYGYLSTVTKPLAEMGYYVFPVALVDQFLKENGLPGPGEMHQAPLKKFAEIFGTDSVMYITLVEYGAKYHVLSSAATVKAEARLVDARSGLLLWEGETRAKQESGGNSGGLIGALVQAAVTQIVASTTDASHTISMDANQMLFTGHGLPQLQAHANGKGGPPLLYGPYRPEGETAN
jgi:hypothetical protein